MRGHAHVREPHWTAPRRPRSGSAFHELRIKPGAAQYGGDARSEPEPRRRRAVRTPLPRAHGIVAAGGRGLREQAGELAGGEEQESQKNIVYRRGRRRARRNRGSSLRLIKSPETATRLGGIDRSGATGGSRRNRAGGPGRLLPTALRGSFEFLTTEEHSQPKQNPSTCSQKKSRILAELC